MAEEHVKITEDYYDSHDADNFYFSIWGGEDIHVGLYQSDVEPIMDASRRTVATMIERLPGLNENAKVLDIGAGYGGAARQMVSKKNCHVTCLNLSDIENQRNRDKIKELGLENNIEVVHGNFEAMPFEDNSFEYIWSEDAILHSDNKTKVFEEIKRVIKPGGYLIFTDPMKADNVPADDPELEPVLKRIHLSDMGSVKLYKELAEKNDMKPVDMDEHPNQLVNHYSRVRQELVKNEAEISKTVSQEYIDNMKNGLMHWINAGNAGKLNWGILLFQSN